MFSFVALAKASSRTTNIYNTLCASALVLLLFDPYLIMSVGFQLSYLAVFGIVFLQPKIYSLMAFRWYVLDKIWVITAVSIAAQLATFALGLLYFHQFPTFFLLSNLVVIPGAFIILSGGLLLLLISFWGSAAMVVGWLLQQVIYLVNELVFYIEAWPNSLITNIYITTPETWLIMGGLLCTIMVFVKSKMYYVYYALVFTLLFAASKWQHIAGFQQEEKLIIYRVNGHTALGFIGDGAAWLYTQADLWNNEDKLRFHIRPSLLRAGVSQVNFNALDGEKALQQLEWQGRRLMILREGVDVADLPKGPVDFLLITRGFKENLDAVVEVLKPEMVILDGSLGNYYSSKYAEEADRLNISYHSIYNNGAITI